MTTTPTTTPTATSSAKVVIQRKKRTVTDIIVSRSTLGERVAAFDTGLALDARALRIARDTQVPYRVALNFMARYAPMTGAPDTNMKLEKGQLPAFGLTIASHLTRMSDGKYANACPHAGQCAAPGVCVLTRGNARYESVGRGREWRGNFLAFETLHALTMVGNELARGIAKHGAVSYRPDVNSDTNTAAIYGDRLTTTPGLTSYNYTKDPLALTRPDLMGVHHVAYSYSERSNAAAVNHALAANVARVAVVTDRRAGQPITQWHPTAKVVDADISDEWMFTPDAVIGDLSFKRTGIDIDPSLAFVQRVGYTATTSGLIAS